MTFNELNPTAVFGQDCYQVFAETHSQTNAFNNPPAVFAPRQPAPWLGDAILALENLATLEENWDSYGAVPVNTRSISFAKTIVSFLSRWVGVSEPAIGATPDGEAGLSWDGGPWSLDAEITKDGQINFVYIDDKDSTRDLERSTHNLYDLLIHLTKLPEGVSLPSEDRTEASEKRSWASVARRSRERWLKENPY